MKPRVTSFRSVALAAGLAALLVPAASPAQAEPSMTVTEFGIYELSRTTSRRPAPRTIGGTVRHFRQAKLVRKTDVIMAQLGRSFGFRVRYRGFKPRGGHVTVRRLHPPSTNPETGRTLSVSEYESPVSGRGQTAYMFTFDHRWEIAEGVWTYQIVHRGKVLAEKKFKVVVPLN